MPFSIYDSYLQSSASGKNEYAYGGSTLTILLLLVLGKSLLESKQHDNFLRGTIIGKFWTFSVENRKLVKLPSITRVDQDDLVELLHICICGCGMCVSISRYVSHICRMFSLLYELCVGKDKKENESNTERGKNIARLSEKLMQILRHGPRRR